MKTSIQDLTAIEMVKDIELENPLCPFLFFGLRRVLEFHRLWIPQAL